MVRTLLLALALFATPALATDLITPEEPLPLDPPAEATVVPLEPVAAELPLLTPQAEKLACGLDIPACVEYCEAASGGFPPYGSCWTWCWQLDLCQCTWADCPPPL